MRFLQGQGGLEMAVLKGFRCLGVQRIDYPSRNP